MFSNSKISNKNLFISITRFAIPVSFALLLSACASTIEGLKKDLEEMTGGKKGKPSAEEIAGTTEAEEAAAEETQSTLVKEIQTKLTKLGYRPGDANGKLTPRTEAAIQDFQLDNDLVIDGKPSRSLLRAISTKASSI